MKVYISYSKDSKTHIARVAALADRLREDGLECVVDLDNPLSPPQGQEAWERVQITSADYVLAVCTKKYRHEFEGHHLLSIFTGKRSGHIARENLNRTSFISVVFSREDLDYIPTALRYNPYFILDSEADFESLYNQVNFWPQVTHRSIKCFISYARNEGETYAGILADDLRRRGVVVELAEGVESFAGISITSELQSSDVLIFLGTQYALNSDVVRYELLAFSLTRRAGAILPIAFGADVVRASFNLMPLLSNISWLEEDPSSLKSGPSSETLNRIYDSILKVIPSRELEDRRRQVELILPVTEQRTLNEGKLILVGRGEVGKTSLVNRLVHDKFYGDEETTQGINIKNWSVRSDSDPVSLHVWDFGGQEIMHATHQFFLTERSLYLLVLNGREGAVDEDAEYWLKLVETFGGDSPVIVVQNKISQHPFDLNYRGLQARYPQIRAFVKTDCKDSIGVEELRGEIRKALEDMPEVRMPFPAPWFNVKRRLETMKESFIGHEAFLALCREEGIAEDGDRGLLSWVLHCLGIALNYRDDWRLRETSVLKPKWVTEGIYRILNAEALAERQGELHLKDLSGLLPKGDYPPDKHAFLLELMRKFSLCFAFTDDSDRYLVPELLGKEEPEEVCEFLPAECLNFEYQYGVLPEGLIPRFIVRSHTLSRGQQRWRFGVILSYEECKALVKAEPGERRIIVRVKGGDAGSRRRLLAIIRYDVDLINLEFKDRLDAQPRVPLKDRPEIAIDYKKLVAFEKQGVKEFPEYDGQGVVTVHVLDLLNGVDLEAQRDESFERVRKAKSVFFSYSHKDEALRDELETHLKLLQRQGTISTWHDRKLLPGREWDKEIDRRLEEANVILLLVSADFIASEYCWDTEVRRALERHEAGEALVIPIILRACVWETAPFGKLQGLPKNVHPITLWEDRDAAWTDVVKGIRELTNPEPVDAV